MAEPDVSLLNRRLAQAEQTIARQQCELEFTRYMARRLWHDLQEARRLLATRGLPAADIIGEGRR